MADYQKHIQKTVQSGNGDAVCLSNPSEVNDAVDKLVALREAKQLKLKLAGREIKIRPKVEKLAQFLVLSNELIKGALGAQPYAALAWSAVSAFLPVCPPIYVSVSVVNCIYS